MFAATYGSLIGRFATQIIENTIASKMAISTGPDVRLRNFIDLPLRSCEAWERQDRQSVQHCQLLAVHRHLRLDGSRILRLRTDASVLRTMQRPFQAYRQRVQRIL